MKKFLVEVGLMVVGTLFTVGCIFGIPASFFFLGKYETKRHIRLECVFTYLGPDSKQYKEIEKLPYEQFQVEYTKIELENTQECIKEMSK